MPALELHGDRASLAVLGEPWTPAGYAIRRRDSTSWELHDDPDPAWSWNDGLRDAVEALVDGRPPSGEIEHDVHVIAIMDAVREAARARTEVAIA
jgi:predicted dehydrogenase